VIGGNAFVHRAGMAASGRADHSFVIVVVRRHGLASAVGEFIA